MGCEILLTRGGNHKLSVVDEAAVVGVDRAEHLFDFLVGHDSAILFKISFLDFVHGELTISVLVEGLEDLG